MTKNQPKAVTIKSVAEAAGLSRATVSAVLHGKTWVQDHTRAKVQHYLQEMGYQHHLIESSLSSHFSQVIGAVMGNIKNPFNSELIASLQEELEQNGIFVFYHTTNETYDSELKALAALQKYGLGAYVISPVQEGNPHDHIQQLVESGKTVITVGELPDVETHVVDFDDRSGSKLATDYLISQGHTRIGCVAGAETSTFAKNRILGYIESLMDHGITLDESLIVRANDSIKEGYSAACELLSGRKPLPTALVCFNDLVATAAYRAAYDLKLRIPDDLSIVGFDDCELAKVLGPPLTTVASYPAMLGKHIAEIILAIQHDPLLGRTPIRKRTQPRLIERRSVCPPATRLKR